MRCLFFIPLACVSLLGCSENPDSENPPVEKLLKCRVIASGDPFGGVEISTGRIEVIQPLTTNSNEIADLISVLEKAEKKQIMETPLVGYAAHFLAIKNDGSPLWLIGQSESPHIFSLEEVEARDGGDYGDYGVTEDSEGLYFESRELTELLEKLLSK